MEREAATTTFKDSGELDFTPDPGLTDDNGSAQATSSAIFLYSGAVVQ